MQSPGLGVAFVPASTGRTTVRYGSPWQSRPKTLGAQLWRISTALLRAWDLVRSSNSRRHGARAQNYAGVLHSRTVEHAASTGSAACTLDTIFRASDCQGLHRTHGHRHSGALSLFLRRRIHRTAKRRLAVRLSSEPDRDMLSLMAELCIRRTVGRAQVGRSRSYPC